VAEAEAEVAGKGNDITMATSLTFFFFHCRGITEDILYCKKKKI